MGDAHRLFVSLVPEPEVAARLLAFLPSGLPPSARAVPSRNVHLTLQFIGDRRTSEIDDVVTSIERATSGLSPLSVAPRRLVTLPEGAPSRLIAVITDCSPTLAELHKRLAHRLASARSRSRDAAFLPHLTIARFSPPAPVPRFSMPVDEAPIRFSQVLLQESLLKPSGAEHRTIASIPLSEPER